MYLNPTKIPHAACPEFLKVIRLVTSAVLKCAARPSGLELKNQYGAQQEGA